MLPVLLVLAAEPSAAALMANARRLAAEPRCAPAAEPDEVTVCGLRRADRFRVPFLVHDPGDPRYEPVAAERTRLLHRTNPIQDLSPFLVGGGMAGVSVSVSGDGKARAQGPRPLAP